MHRPYALPLLASGVALIALAVTILPFEPRAAGLIEQGYGARLNTLRPAALVAVLLSLLAGIACWWRPRHALALLLLALALGTASGTATLIVAPQIFETSPARLALTLR